MQKFLMTETFADFLLLEARIDTSVRFLVDGRVRREFYTKEEREGQDIKEFVAWESVRPQIMQIVKGKRPPLLMKLSLAYAPKKAKELFLGEEQETEGDTLVKYLLCTVKYENGTLTLTGGISYQGFTMDKSLEKHWDKALCEMADEIGLEYEII